MKQRITFITGKGGVGKSTLAAAWAQKLHQQGKKVLLAEIADQSYLQGIYGFSKACEEHPCEIKPGLSFIQLTGPSCLKRYTMNLLRSETLYKLFFQNPVSLSLMQAAPGLRELAILGQITSGIRGHGPSFEVDEIVVDSPATGHFLSLLKSPIGMAKTIKWGPMGEQSRNIGEILRDTEKVKYVIATLAEELPLAETLDLTKGLSELGMNTHCILLNRMWDVPNHSKQNKESEAVQYLHRIDQQQKNSIKQLHALKIEVKPIHQVWKIEPKEVIAQLQDQLPC